MHIGVDATCWQNNRGYGRHARALLNALVQADTNNRYTLVMDSAADPDTLPARARVRVLPCKIATAQAASARSSRGSAQMWRMSRALSSRDFDAVLFPTVYSFVPVWTRAKKLVMIHDIIAETFPRLTVPHWTARCFWRAKVALGRYQADAVVTVSEYSRQGITRQFGLPAERVHIVGEASDPVFRVLPEARLAPALTAQGLHGGRRMVVYVGGFSPHKNLDALVDAFAALSQEPAFADACLVMVGEYRKEVFHSTYSSLAQRIESLGLTQRVIFTGYLPDEELVPLLNLAAVLVLPSLMEGFGLPAVEAAACGCPVIATKESPLPDLLGEGGLYIDPREPRLADVLRDVLSCPARRARMRQAGLAAARRLTWDAAATQMMDVLRQVVPTGATT